MALKNCNKIDFYASIMRYFVGWLFSTSSQVSITQDPEAVAEGGAWARQCLGLAFSGQSAARGCGWRECTTDFLIQVVFVVTVICTCSRDFSPFSCVVFAANFPSCSASLSGLTSYLSLLCGNSINGISYFTFQLTMSRVSWDTKTLGIFLALEYTIYVNLPLISFKFTRVRYLM